MSRHDSRSSRIGAAILVAGALLLIAPTVTPQPVREIGAPAENKPELYRNSLAMEFGELPAQVTAGRRFQSELLERSGGWTGDQMPWEASGTFHVAEGSTAAPLPERRVVTVLVRTEVGIPVDVASFAVEVMEILNDPRGWGDIDDVSFARTAVDAEADIVLTLASPATTEVLCGELPTRGYTSCGRGRPVNINGARWVEGATAFLEAGGTLEDYRVYVINHEIGHSLGHPHESCPRPGALAPTMMQQTLHVGECIANGWPNL